MRTAIATTAAGILGMPLQTTVLPALLPVWLTPNLLFVLAVYLGLRHPGAAAFAGAFLLGYFLDAFSGTQMGMNALAFTVSLAAVGLVAGSVWTDGGVPTMVVVFAAGCVYGLTITAILWLGEPEPTVWRHALRYGVLHAGLAALVTRPVFDFLAWEQRLLGAA